MSSIFASTFVAGLCAAWAFDRMLLGQWASVAFQLTLCALNIASARWGWTRYRSMSSGRTP